MLPPNNFTKREEKLRLAGLVPLTTLDYPDNLSAVLFCHGCCWHCPYCHNEYIIDINTPVKGAPTWDSALDFLQKRKGLLDAVVFSGGEPLLQPAVKDAIRTVKSLGFKVALHTNGHNPAMLGEVLPDISWIGLDIKAPFASYYKAVSKNESTWEKTKAQNFGAKVEESLDIIIKAGTPFECRTTLDPRILTKDDLRTIAHTLHKKGVAFYAMQEYRKTGEDALQPSDSAISSFFTDKALLAELGELFPHLILRRA